MGEVSSPDSLSEKMNWLKERSHPILRLFKQASTRPFIVSASVLKHSLQTHQNLVDRPLVVHRIHFDGLIEAELDC